MRRIHAFPLSLRLNGHRLDHLLRHHQAFDLPDKGGLILQGHWHEVFFLFYPIQDKGFNFFHFGGTTVFREFS